MWPLKKVDNIITVLVVVVVVIVVVVIVPTKHYVPNKYFFPHLQIRNWSKDRLSHSFKMAWPVNGWAGIQIPFQHQDLCIFHTSDLRMKFYHLGGWTEAHFFFKRKHTFYRNTSGNWAPSVGRITALSTPPSPSSSGNPGSRWKVSPLGRWRNWSSESLNPFPQSQCWWVVGQGSEHRSVKTPTVIPLLLFFLSSFLPFCHAAWLVGF